MNLTRTASHVLVAMGFVAIANVHAFAQAPARASVQPVFEVASVKPNNGGIGPGNPGGRAQDPARVSYRNLAMRLLLIRAFDLKANEIYQISMPGWVIAAAEAQQRYDIDAKIPPGATKEQLPLMLQNLLVERFGMRFHREKRDVPSYDLVVAKGGVKMKESAPATSGATVAGRGLVIQKDKDGKEELAPGRKAALLSDLAGGGMRWSGRLQTMADLASICRNQIGRPVTDETGLTRSYDFNIDFSQRDSPSAVDPSSESNVPLADARDGLPPFLMAIQSLGLRLQPTKVATDVVVIDHLEKVPTTN